MNNNHFDSFCYGERANDRNMQDRIRNDRDAGHCNGREERIHHCHNDHSTHNGGTGWIALLAALLIIYYCC